MRDTTHETLRRILSSASTRSSLPPGLVPSAVLLPIFHHRGEYHLVFNKRTDLVEYHKGEICFPGGGQDPEDLDLVATALRETREEMGIEPGDVDLLGGLTPVATRTGFSISPMVGLIPHPYLYRPSAIEVAEVLEVPFSALLDPANLREEATLARGALSRGFSFAYGRHIIYGATARIATQLLATVAPALGMEVPWPSALPGSMR